MDYLDTLKLAHRHREHLQQESLRMTIDESRSFVRLMVRASRALEKRFHNSEALQLAVRSDPSGTEAEFRNIPQRLLLIARWAGDIHKGTARKRRPMYNDALAELLWYVQIATKKQHLNEVAILIGHFTNRPDYAFNDLSSWKVDHKEELTRARLRLTGKS